MGSGADYLGFEHLEFYRVAVLPTQIRSWSLPTRPTKLDGNRHAKGWGDRESVELDAIPAGKLRDLARLMIGNHIDQRQLAALRAIEAEEREQLRIFGDRVAGGAP